MIVTLYDADTGEYRGTVRGSQVTAEEHGRAAYRAVEGKRERDTFHDGKRVRQRHEFKPRVADGAVRNLPAGTEIVQDGIVIETLEKAGAVALPVDHDQTVEIELRHPRYGRKSLSVECRASDRPKGTAVHCGRSRGELRHRAYNDLREQSGAWQKILKAVLAVVPEVRELLEREAPDALAELDAVDAVKRQYP